MHLPVKMCIQQSDAISLDLQGHVLSPLLWLFLYQHKNLFTMCLIECFTKIPQKRFTNFGHIIPFKLSTS
ncbi:hypothetical protein BDA96_02G360300 [Sorghum bicolor]|uniref:Uncharacterized protein n=2 Tax=Sorghum bicolor TaxID=4558 RepID=A0A921UUT8_SORBI|nr:hypothetical protein SORBI_3002G343800 [Sorghum bicolor]KAG0545424.1 hypothetical protein BDA96_02G360300 [Sorghum bicolor]